MATYYVYSGATGSGTGANWANAYTTLTTAFTSKAAGDVFYVAHDHAESTAAAITLTTPGTLASPCSVLCVNRAGSVPPVSADLRTTATVSTTGASSITFGVQRAYWYGLIFQAGSAASAASITFSNLSSVNLVFENCGFTLNNTSSTSRINLCNGSGVSGISLNFVNCTWTFGNSASQQFSCANSSLYASITGGSVVTGANAPTTLFGSMPPVLSLVGVDLSTLGSSKTLIGASTTSGSTRIEECRLGSSVTVAATPTTRNQKTVLIRSDSTSVATRYEKYTAFGTETTETTIVRSGGASDGTTAQARKIVTTANSSWVWPFESEPMAIWNDTSGSSKTATVYGIWGGAAVPNTDDIWIEVGYLNSSSYPLGALGTATKADILATGSALSSDTSSWGGSTTAFKMSVTFTPQMKGPLYVVVKAAKASSTFYYDPLISVT